MFSDRRFVRPTPQFQRFLLQNDFLTKEVTPLDPSQQIRIEIPHKKTCLPAPHLFSDLQWCLERSEQGATEDMTSVGLEDMSSVAEGRVMLENQITVKNLRIMEKRTGRHSGY